jgi:hypothetical protein
LLYLSVKEKPSGVDVNDPERVMILPLIELLISLLISIKAIQHL